MKLFWYFFFYSLPRLFSARLPRLSLSPSVSSPWDRAGLSPRRTVAVPPSPAAVQPDGPRPCPIPPEVLTTKQALLEAHLWLTHSFCCRLHNKWTKIVTNGWRLQETLHSCLKIYTRLESINHCYIVLKFNFNFFFI